MDSLARSSTQPNSDLCEFDERQIVGCELVISGRDTSALLDLVEEPFDEIARTIQIRAEADRVAQPPRLSGGRLISNLPKSIYWNFMRRGGFWYSGAVCFIYAAWRQEYSAES